MAVKDIVTLKENSDAERESSVLFKVAKKVSSIDETVENAVRDLRDTLHSDDLSVGLAAPQIGIGLAIIVINLQKNKSEDLVLINPEIVEETGQKDTKYESCMSIPHKKGQVTRKKKARVKYLSLEGSVEEISATGFEARVLQHEIDHVNGILYIDRMASDDELEDTEMFREHGIN